MGRGGGRRPPCPAPSPARARGLKFSESQSFVWFMEVPSQRHDCDQLTGHWPALSPLEAPAGGGSRVPALRPCLVFLGSSPTLPPSRAPDTSRHISAQELLLVPWRLQGFRSRELGTRAKTDTLQPGAHSGSHPVLHSGSDKPRCVHLHRHGSRRRTAVPAGLWAWRLLWPTPCTVGPTLL